jgi:hypothetical protein
VAQNAVKHGACSALPVIPGLERQEDWEGHRAGVLQSLAPAGRLEQLLAERVAQMLWRLDRVARFETAAISLALAGAADPTPAPPNPLHHLLGGANQGDKLAEAVKQLEHARVFLSETLFGIRAYKRLPKMADAAPLSWVDAFEILQAAYNELTEAQMMNSPGIEEEEFLMELGATNGAGIHEVEWTAGLVRRGLALVARNGRVPADQLAVKVLPALKALRDERQAAVATRTAEVEHLERKQRLAAERRQAQLTLPEGNAEAKVLRYESHLSRQLYQALHELQRLQAARAGQPVPAPLAVEVGVNVSTDTNGVGSICTAPA